MKCVCVLKINIYLSVSSCDVVMRSAQGIDKSFLGLLMRVFVIGNNLGNITSRVKNVLILIKTNSK